MYKFQLIINTEIYYSKLAFKVAVEGRAEEEKLVCSVSPQEKSLELRWVYSTVSAIFFSVFIQLVVVESVNPQVIQ